MSWACKIDSYLVYLPFFDHTFSTQTVEYSHTLLVKAKLINIWFTRLFLTYFFSQKKSRMDIRIKRICKELAQFNESPPEHIYIDYDETNVTHLEVLFIGPRETPYSRMFMRFTVDFPVNYPIQPPKVTFISSYDRKIHPNIFPGGWVCLSTLHTNDSSGWVTSINLTALLVTIYSMFTREMIMIDNTHSHEKSEDFFPGVMYDTFYINSRLLHDETNPKLKQVMIDYTVEHADWYLRKLERLAEQYDGKELQNYYKPRIANFKAIADVFTELA